MCLLRYDQLSFGLIISYLQVVAALVGQEPLPWTGSNKEKFVNELGQVAEIVMRLLNRDPSRRATARQVHTAFN